MPLRPARSSDLDTIIALIHALAGRRDQRHAIVVVEMRQPAGILLVQHGSRAEVAHDDGIG